MVRFMYFIEKDLKWNKYAMRTCSITESNDRFNEGHFGLFSTPFMLKPHHFKIDFVPISVSKCYVPHFNANFENCGLGEREKTRVQA